MSQCVCVVCASAFTKFCKQEFDGKLFYSTFDTLVPICFELFRINLILLDPIFTGVELGEL
jgi:hypothetical protein